MLDYFYILCMINMAIFIIFFFALMKKRGYTCKCKSKTKLVLTSILVIALIIWRMPFGTVALFILIRIILSLFLICKTIYKMDTKKSITNSVIYTLVYILIECSIYWILQLSSRYVALNLLELNLIITFIIIFICTYFFDKIQKFYDNKRYYIYIILTITVNLVIVLFFNISEKKIGDLYSLLVKNNLEYISLVDTIMFSFYMKNIFPYLLFIINVILISIFINSIKSEKEKVKTQFLNEKLDMQYKYYLMAKESKEKMKKVYHDMNNHMENIKRLKGNSEDVNKYINNIEDEVKNVKNIYNTGNLLLDIILYEKSKVCMESNIDFKVGIDFSKCEFIEMIDITSIFSNLIDNAIEACNNINDKDISRYITIKSTFIKGYYVIRCENSKMNKVILKNNKIFTTKKDKFFHGLGLENIKSSVKKYDGELKIKNNDYKFIASIYIPIE
ncbi:two-component sensor histidine kinase [[Clostridium] sordellii]|uniref:Fragment of two-component sensor histidine kinase (N-terminal region) n=2 Tax=Paraclostridium sordellii TaxID=1505 RepID=A0ABM9RNN5_PARSO|nr:ATP-binding protein [Paeniclostridium sordellii]CEJ73656.1 Fragment of two-component sensor histidine kinase (N-terminal region) [[Clostridium] sordellii] [Paeniclostridium sordellii]CEN69204.1 two-component sensor histidine kinase [[Clostridium] sordellii] [Paeniclostridium sordellii]CEN72472.1 two-component sensor histidine kinase [[Clostridium] sordellii] [Paeniclostridium sordellii]CEO23950.1 two-component sensor histidine kinase [[Clostridium] sordellii] [Paeniclostridium sordellii]CEP